MTSNNLIIRTQIDMIGTELERLNENFLELYENPDTVNNQYDFQQLPQILNNISFCADQLQTIIQKIYCNE